MQALSRAPAAAAGQASSSATLGVSCCQQLLMGEGKTTVISPLLCLLLGSARTLVTRAAGLRAVLTFSGHTWTAFSQASTPLVRKANIKRGTATIIVDA